MLDATYDSRKMSLSHHTSIFSFLVPCQLKPLTMAVLFFPSRFFLLIKKTWEQKSSCEGSNVKGFISTSQTYELNHRGLLYVAGTVTLTSAFHFGAFLRQQLWSCHMLKLRHAVYVRPVHSFPTSNTPIIKDILLHSECHASLSSVFLREFNRQASFTKTPYKKTLKILRYAYKNMHD